MLDHKTGLNKFKKTEIIYSIFSKYIEMKLEISNRRKARKFINMWKLNNTFLNNQWVTEEIRNKTNSTLRQTNKKTTTYPNSWDTVLRDSL